MREPKIFSKKDLSTIHHGTVICKELLGGVDLATDQGRQEAKDRKLFSTTCVRIVMDAARVLDDLL